MEGGLGESLCDIDAEDVNTLLLEVCGICLLYILRYKERGKLRCKAIREKMAVAGFLTS